MYVREKTIKRGKNVYRYFQLVRSTWVEGKSRQTVIRHLGPWGHRDAAIGYAKVAGYLCGTTGCLNEPTTTTTAYYKSGPKRGKGHPVCLCDEHELEFKAANEMLIRDYEPEKAEEWRTVIRKPPAGGRPPFQLQDRDSAMKPTSFDEE